ncbi:ENTH/ANTH/VHS superfamily protein [Actinidia rufa]|uniref:ENTH/ANTH/VHS superfamily protein n=1 Tax=Actinidia rufa TaxID=165716 RepID=A0A7J0ES72_9ERIC|nr:ENTH/ANTH/VHS superfamily protein [Actinidia rufa]
MLPGIYTWYNFFSIFLAPRSMAPSKLQKAIGAVKDQTSISLAKVDGNTSLSDLDVAIVKATRHEEYPADERHIREILSLTCHSRLYVGACVTTISRRLSKTKNWVVALKMLMLIQRLLAEGDPAFVQEIFFATRRGTRFLNMSDFRGTSRSNSWDYSAFVRTHALYLDEQLEYRMQYHKGKRGLYYEEEEASPATHLMQLLERFLACRPAGSAKLNRVVFMALYPIVKESYRIYDDITDLLADLIDRFVVFEVADCVRVYEIFSRVAKQFDELDEFYGWCKNVGIARSSEYPEVEKITQKKLDLLDNFIRDKSSSALNRKPVYLEQSNKTEEDKKSEVVEEDMNAIKALPPLEGEDPEKEEKEEVEKLPEEKSMGDKLSLALFDGGAPPTGPETTTSPWEAFTDTENWETELVQSTSHLSNQKPLLPGGFDTLLLDGMYQQGMTNRAMASSGYNATGSASSVAFGSAGRPAMLALPAPPAADGNSAAPTSADPFAASLPVPPPSYVQMSEMEKQQRLLVEEHLMWQQYAKEGMPGRAGLTKIQPNPYPYNMGGYAHTY